MKTRFLPPSFINTPPEVELLFVALSGKTDKTRKCKLMSDMLIDWVGGLRLTRSSKSGNFYHQPCTINVMVRTLLAAMKEYFNCEFTVNDFKFDGGYAAFFPLICEQRQKKDVSEHSY